MHTSTVTLSNNPETVALLIEAERLDAQARSAWHRNPSAAETVELMSKCRAAHAAAHAALVEERKAKFR